MGAEPEYLATSTPWHDSRYLLSGTPRQQAAYKVLQALNIFEVLQDYRPVLAGSLPLDIDIPSSDLDLLCQAEDLQDFQEHVSQAYASQAGFQVRRKSINAIPSLIAKFSRDGFPVEIFAQPLAVQDQRAYRHMLVEERLLRLGGEPARRGIRQLKLAGMKTEPAFGVYFNLPGDPYLTLLELGQLDEASLRSALGEYHRS